MVPSMAWWNSRPCASGVSKVKSGACMSVMTCCVIALLCDDAVFVALPLHLRPPCAVRNRKDDHGDDGGQDDGQPARSPATQLHRGQNPGHARDERLVV